jgi:Tfp pilus assembly protein PilV
MTSKAVTSKVRSQEGFTLIEACVATLILIVGIVGISNLSVVAIMDNSAAHRATTAAFLAAQKLEELKATPYEALTDSSSDALETDETGFNEVIQVAGSGSFRVRWMVRTVGSALPPMRQIVAAAEALGANGRRTRAEFTTFRTCSYGTAAGCP